MFGLLDCDGLSIRLFELRSLLLGIIIVEVELGACLYISGRKQSNAENCVAEQVLRATIRVLIVGIVDKA